MSISVEEEKRKILNAIIIVILVLGTVVDILVIVRDLKAGVYPVNSIVNTFVLIAIAYLLVGKGVRFNTKAWVVIIVFQILAIKSFLNFANVSGGSVFFLYSTIIAFISFDYKRGLWTAIFSALIFIALSMAFNFELLKAKIDINLLLADNSRWVNEIVVFGFLLFILVAGVGQLQVSFLKTIEEANISNLKLKEVNDVLKQQLLFNQEMKENVVETEQKFERLFEESNDGIIVANRESIIVEANQSICKLTGYSRGDLIHQYASKFVSKEYQKLIADFDYTKLERRRLWEIDLLTVEGNKIPVELSFSVIGLNQKEFSLITIRDLRERKEAEQKLLDAVIQAEENERSRFAKDLHDDLGPIFSSIKLYLQSLRQKEDKEDKKLLINKLLATVDDSIKSIRTISYNLSSYLLQNIGLIEALRSHVERINQNSDFKINLTTNLESIHRLPLNIEITTYRIVLELINNSIRHSEGNIIDLHLLKSGDRFVIDYEDNGKGFDYPKMLNDNSKGIGLKNIVNRIKSIKGLLFYHDDRSGFAISISIKV